MLQVFYLDIAYVALAIHVCCKCFIWMLHMLQCPYTYVASVCCKCFINFGRMLQQMLFTLQVFHLQARLVSAGRGGPLGRSGPHVHKARCGAQSRHGARGYLHAGLLSLSHLNVAVMRQ